MAKKNSVNIPGAGGGIFHVATEEGSGLQIKPEYVIGFSALVVITEVLLHFFI